MKHLKSFNESWRDWILSAAMATSPLGAAATKIPDTSIETRHKQNINFPVIVQDEYTASDCDALHAFQSRRKRVGNKMVTEDVGRMNEKVGAALNDLYQAGWAPKVTKVEVTVKDMTVKWKVTIEESQDGKAWVGFTSRGAGCNGDVQRRAVSKELGYDINTLKDTIASRVGEPLLEIQKVGDITYNHPSNGFRQVFYAYTKPQQAPAPKSNAVNYQNNSDFQVGDTYLTRNTKTGKTHLITITDAKKVDGRWLDVSAKIDDGNQTWTFDVTVPGKFGHNTQNGDFVILKKR